MSCDIMVLFMVHNDNKELQEYINDSVAFIPAGEY